MLFYYSLEIGNQWEKFLAIIFVNHQDAVPMPCGILLTAFVDSYVKNKPLFILPNFYTKKLGAFKLFSLATNRMQLPIDHIPRQLLFRQNHPFRVNFLSVDQKRIEEHALAKFPAVDRNAGFSR